MVENAVPEARDAVAAGRCLCGAVDWRFTGPIPGATICNCTACRRYGALWAYGVDGESIHIDDPQAQLAPYVRRPGAPLSFNVCRTCGNLVSWRWRRTDAKGRTRAAVNLRLAEPEAVADIPLRRLDGLHEFQVLPRDGRRVADAWF